MNEKGGIAVCGENNEFLRLIDLPYMYPSWRYQFIRRSVGLTATARRKIVVENNNSLTFGLIDSIAFLVGVAILCALHGCCWVSLYRIFVSSRGNQDLATLVRDDQASPITACLLIHLQALMARSTRPAEQFYVPVRTFCPQRTLNFACIPPQSLVAILTSRPALLRAPDGLENDVRRSRIKLPCCFRHFEPLPLLLLLSKSTCVRVHHIIS